MTNQVFSNRYATTQATTTIVDVTAPQKIQVKYLHLSVPAGQNAQVFLGSNQVASTEGFLNMPVTLEGAPGDDLKLSSSGAVSITAVFQVATRV